MSDFDTMTNWKNALRLALLCSAMGFALVACDDGSQQEGSVESTVEGAAEATGDAIENAGEATERAAENASSAVEGAVDRTTN